MSDFRKGTIVRCDRSSHLPWPHEPGWFLVTQTGRGVHIWGGPWARNGQFILRADGPAELVRARKDRVPDAVWTALAKKRLLGEI